MILYSIDDDSDSKESDFLSMGGEDVDVYLNHYRIPKLINSNSNGASTSAKVRGNGEQIKYNNEGKIISLTELAAQKVACHLPFGQVEHFDPPVPEPMQCRIAFWSFPQDEEDIRLYTCLANGNADEFIRAENLVKFNCVCDMLQVGFHLSANIKFIQDIVDDLNEFRVAITFDRRRITSCSCSCSATTFWCQHAVAVCLQRIRRPQEVTLRAPVSESLQRLEKNQLQKFAQYLINELPQQILPAAQKLLDELLSGDEAVINKNPAAPDPTAGATINEQTSWCLDDTHLSMDIERILHQQCIAQPTVCSDIQALHLTSPPAATEYSQLLRPIRGREPEGLWNLISIVGEMMRRRDSNFLLLLDIMTHEVMKCEKIVTWWFETKVSLHSGSTIHLASTKSNSASTSQYSCSNFCDEIVHLWRLAAMDPSLSASERKRLHKKFFDWHLSILKRHDTVSDGSVLANLKIGKRNLLELFPGFKSSMEGCLIDWSDWDDKKNRLICQKAKSEEEVAKPSKSAKKRKKKSRASRQSKASSTVGPSVQDLENPAKSKNLTIPNDQGNDEVVLISENIENKENSGESGRNVQVDSGEPSSGSPESRNLLPEAACPQQRNIPEPENIRIEQDLQVYYMDKTVENEPDSQKPGSLENFIRVNVRLLNDPLETLYAKAEGLCAHGHTSEARRLAFKVANEILSYPNYPSVKRQHSVSRRKKKGSLDNQMSIAASETLTKIAFLSNVLIDDPENHNLVFRLIIFGVEMKRSPAATKPLEVKLINQKHDLITLLKTIPLHETELDILREKAQAICHGLFQENHDALTTLIFGNYIFEALVLSKSLNSVICNARPVNDGTRVGSSLNYNQGVQYQLDDHHLPPGDINQQQGSHSSDQLRQQCSVIVHGKLPLDSSLGFQAALSAISVKVNLPEVDHPLLCEGTRRQRGELALSLLTYYKDDQESLDLILKHLLDKDAVLSPQSKADSLDRLSKKNSPSQDPNQPTEASAHFMFELAKSLFDKAGGNSLTAHLFRPQLITQNENRDIHSRLHMCTLRIALYALGLQNRKSPNWMQRTYNGRASFIHEQALEIGLPAIKFLSDNWEGYLTPVEVASIADKAGCSNDAETTKFAAEMAKSCLKYAHNLDYNAVRRILAQCKEQSIEMIEEALVDIERVAGKESVSADVLFAVARAWFGLYEKLITGETHLDYIMRESVAPEQDAGASCWLLTYNPDKRSCNEPTRHVHWDSHSRVDVMPTIYTPTYKHIEYVKTAYRVGVKALDALKPSQLGSKHYPKKEDDVSWLLGLSKSLGRDCLHTFSRSVIKNITNPHILHFISSDLIKFFESLPEDHIDRVNILLPLVDRCLDRFVKQTKDLMKNISYDQMNYLDSIIDVAQDLTGAANTLTAASHFRELLRIVDVRKPKTKKLRNYIETRHRHVWVNDLLSIIKHCTCTKCHIGREMSVKFLTCHQRT